MTNNGVSRRRRFLVPEVVQTSAMDCGPASLKSLLEGFHVPASYGRLREACQTDVDGTSINTIEEVARDLGLDATQVMVPVDHVLLNEAGAMPAIAVVRRPGGETHFLIVWRRHRGTVQLMDPATGRRWTTMRHFTRELYVHAMPVPADAWRRWAGSEEFLAPLRRRLRDVGVSGRRANRLIDEGLSDASWRSIAALDATVRMVDSLVRAGGLKRGRVSARFLVTCFKKVAADPEAHRDLVPGGYWCVRPYPGAPPGTDYLLVHGAVVVRVRGRQPAAPAEGEVAPARKPLSAELQAALKERPARPGRDLLRLLREDGLLAPVVLALALVLAAAGVVIEALLFRTLIDVGQSLGLGTQRVGALGYVVLFVACVLVLELITRGGTLRAGRRLEARLRVAFLRKIPRLGDRYFRSRPVSDMTERSHSVHALRMLPVLGGQFLRTLFALALTTLAVIWLDPGVAVLALVLAALSVALPLICQPIIGERELRLRTHAGALSRFYLDALLGAIPIRAHGAERAVCREHEGLLVEWARAGLRLQRAIVGVETIVALAAFSVAAWILFDHVARFGESSRLLLLAYWTLNIPVLGQMLTQMGRQYPVQRNIAMRLMEPLGALEDAPAEASPEEPGTSVRADAPEPTSAEPPALRLEGVTVKAAGHVILQEIDLDIRPGTHVAIVGSSGAGKSSLVGLLLGWHRAAEGRVLVDDEELTGPELTALRRRTAWVDPAVQLWNRPLVDNLRYGSHEADTTPLTAVIREADLREVLESQAEGLQTPLGEGGAFISGGEGQRVRLGRGMYRRDARLVILDEAFRGLDRAKRRDLLARARSWWKDATLLCISHDVGDTLAFDRVLVIEGGRLVEDGDPSALAQRPGSRFRAMLDKETAVREQLWSSAHWRRMVLDEGRLRPADNN